MGWSIWNSFWNFFKDSYWIKQRINLQQEQLASDVSKVIAEVNPDFDYPFALATNLFEMSNDHIYFAKHLPRLTEVSVNGSNVDEVEKMLNSPLV